MFKNICNNILANLSHNIVAMNMQDDSLPIKFCKKRDKTFNRSELKSESLLSKTCSNRRVWAQISPRLPHALSSLIHINILSLITILTFMLQFHFILTDYIIFPESESNKIFRYTISESFLIQNGTEISPPNLANPLALDIDPIEKRIYTTNSQSGTILRFNFDGSSVEIIRKLNPLNSLTSGVSVDPVSKLIYYGDPGTDTISVMRLDGLYHKELFHENTTKVKAIQVAPQLGLLFWTDWGHPPKIERANMDGSNRMVIIDTKLVMPWSLAVDQKERKLYWGDAKLKKIEVANLDGSSRQVVLETKVIYPFGLTLYQDHLIWSDWSQSKILALKKTERDAHHVVDPVDRLFDKLGDIKIYSEAQTKELIANSPCAKNNGDCNQLCFPTPLSTTDPTETTTGNLLGKTCGCQDGSTLMFDSHTCDSYKPLDEFLLVSDSYQGKVMIMDMANNSRHYFLPITELKRPDAVDYDPVERFVYWVDEATKVIRRIHIDPTGPVNGRAMRFLNDLVSNPTGMAIDSLSRLIYYNNAGLKLMAVMDLDGNNHKVLITGLDDPRALALDPEEGLIFWTEWGDTPTIKSAWGDGSNVKVLASESVSNPTGITVDHKEKQVYWCDARLDKIERMSYDGTNRSIIFFGTSIHPYGIAIDDNFIYWSDWTRSNILRSPKHGQYNDKLSLGPKVFSRLGTLRVYLKNRTALINGCAYTNGGCSHICLPLPQSAGGRRVTCACPDGLILSPDKQTCSSQTEIFDEFLLFADGVLPDIFIMSAKDPKKYHAIPYLNHSRPAALDYDPVDKLIYWSDVRDRSIKRAGLDGDRFDIVKTLLTNVSLPDGLTLDPYIRLIYYSDTGRNVISVLTLDGLKHRDIVTDNLDEPRAIQLDSENGYMYWTDWGVHAKIEKAYMDGTNRKTLIEDDIVWPNGLSLDKQNKRLFWVDAKRDILASCNLDGNNIQTHVSMVRKHPFALTLTPQYFFWTDWITSTIRRLPRIDLMSNESIAALLNSPTQSIAPLSPKLKRQLLSTQSPTIQQKLPKQVAISSLTSAPVSETDSTQSTTLQSGLFSSTPEKPNSRSGVNSDDGAPGTSGVGIGVRPFGNTALSMADKVSDITNPTFSRLLDIHAYVKSSYTPEKFRNHPCAQPDKGGCSDICVPVPDARRKVCLCADLHYPNDRSRYSGGPLSRTKALKITIMASDAMAKGDEGLSASESSNSSAATINLGGTILPRRFLYGGQNRSPLIRFAFNTSDEPIEQNPLLPDGLTCRASLICPENVTSTALRFPGVQIDDGENGNKGCKQMGRLGSNCTFKCRPGFVKDHGDEVRTCQSNGFWSGKPLTCKGRSCSSFASPPNTILVSCPGSFGTKCVFQCAPGSLYISGDRERTCNADGSWTGSPLVCQKTSCRYPYLDEENVIVKECPLDPKPGQVCHLRCKPGYVPKVGSETAVCQDDGTWSQPLLSCHALYCDTKPNPANAIEISCYEDAATITNVSLSSSTSPIVNNIDNSNNKVGTSRFSIGSQCVHKCAPNYNYISGAKARECLENGVWSGEPLICSACSQLPKPDRGRLECHTLTPTLSDRMNFKQNGPQTACSIVCDPGTGLAINFADIDLTRTNRNNIVYNGKNKVSSPSTINNIYTISFVCPSDGFDNLLNADLMWNPTLNTVPGCSDLVLPESQKISGNIVLYFTDPKDKYDRNQECDDTILLGAIKKWLRNSPLIMPCMDSDLCTITSLDVQCMESKNSNWFNYTYSFGTQNSLNGQFFPAQEGVQKTSDFAINMTNLARNFDKSVKSGIFSSVRLVSVAPKFNIDPALSNIRYRRSEGSIDDITCAKGHVLIPNTNDCAACPVGTFYDKLSQKCTVCPVGTYQALAGQTKCEKCLDSYTTLYPGSSQCQSSISINASSLKTSSNMTSGAALVVALVLFLLIAILIGAFTLYHRRGMKLPAIAKIPLPPTLSGRGKADTQEMTNVPYETF